MTFEELKHVFSLVVIAGIVLEKSVALYRAAKTKTWDRFTLDVSWIVFCGSLLVFNMVLYLWPRLRAPEPWQPSNPTYILRFPGNLVLFALCLLPCIVFSEYRLNKAKKKQGGGRTVELSDQIRNKTMQTIMKRALRAATLGALLPASLFLVARPGLAQNEATAWKSAPAPLMTRWAKDVRPENPRPEYPRPLLVRKEWQSLNGLWQFAFDDKNEGRAAGWQSGRPLPEQILVPFTFEAALSGIGKGKEIHERIWYRRTFEVPRAWRPGAGKKLRLNFGACDWETTVWVNGKQAGEPHRGGYTPFSFDITDTLRAGGMGPQEIVVAVYDPADPKTTGWQPKGKQLGSESIWYTRTTGIWQTVWLEPVDAHNHITTARVEADPAGRQVFVHLSTERPYSVRRPLAVVFGPDGRKIAESRDDKDPYRVIVSVPVPKLWSPESPALYDVVVTLRDETGRTLDEVKTYAAFRTYGIANGRLTLNGKPYFLRGVLDQGFWPDGIYTPPTDAAIKSDVEMTKRLGFNMARKHVKVEDPRWYYWCDKLGLAVWQDMPSSHNLSTEDARKNFTQEWRETVEAVRGYPCVVHYIPFNENWGNPQAFQDDIVTLTRQLDPTRPITDASGWTQRGLTDVVDAHDYGNNLRAQGVENPQKPKVVGEYGGIALPVAGHTWTTGWGYQNAKDENGLLRRMGYQTTQLFEAANLSGFVYTQLTDVEQELNGLLTYDRQPKASVEKIAAIFTGAARGRYDFGGFLRDWYVVGPLPTGTRLHSANDTPESHAIFDQVLAKPFVENEATLTPGDNDRAPVRLAGADPASYEYRWNRVKSDADVLDFQKVFEHQQNNAVAYAVAYFDAPADLANVVLRFGSDDAARVWLNGALVHTVNRVRGVSLDEDEVTGLTLKRGRNVLVVKVAQGIGGWGLAARFEKADGTVLRDLRTAASTTNSRP